MIFSLDTAADRCSVAALHPDGTVHARASGPGETRLEQALPLVRSVLDPLGGPACVRAFAFGAGPGAFTGLRVACTLVQGMAFATGRPVLPVGNLEALAHMALRHAPEGAQRRPGRVLVAIDARMHEAYWAVFEQSPGPVALRRLAHESTCPVAGLASLAAQWDVGFISGNAFALSGVRDRLAPELREQHEIPGLADALAIAQLAAARVDTGLAAREALPLYVRDRVACTVAERAAGIRL